LYLGNNGNRKICKDFPFIDLASLRVATRNFTDSNKLGEGGFGPVYKVNRIQVYSPFLHEHHKEV